MGYLYGSFSLPIGLSALDLGLMYATDRQHHLLMPRLLEAGHNNAEYLVYRTAQAAIAS